MRKPHLGFVIFYGNGQGLFGTNQDNQLLSSGDTSIDQIPLKKKVVLGHDRKDYGREITGDYGDVVKKVKYLLNFPSISLF